MKTLTEATGNKMSRALVLLALTLALASGASAEFLEEDWEEVETEEGGFVSVEDPLRVFADASGEEDYSDDVDSSSKIAHTVTEVDLQDVSMIEAEVEYEMSRRDDDEENEETGRIEFGIWDEENEEYIRGDELSHDINDPHNEEDFPENRMGLGGSVNLDVKADGIQSGTLRVFARAHSSNSGITDANFTSIEAVEPEIEAVSPEDGYTSSSEQVALEAEIHYPGDNQFTVNFVEDGGDVIGTDTGTEEASTTLEISDGDEIDWHAEIEGEDAETEPRTVFGQMGEWQVELFGEDTMIQGETAPYTAQVENVGTTTDEVLINFTKNGEQEHTQQVELDPGGEHEETTLIEFNDASIDHEICVEAGEASDCMEVAVTEIAEEEEWRDLVDFRMDLTGPDSGLGWDMDDSWEGMDESHDYPPTVVHSRDEDPYTNHDRVFFTDIYWQGTYEKVDQGENLDQDDLIEEHQAPMCGSNMQEYLLEQSGHAENPEKGTGPFACFDTHRVCHYRTPVGEKRFDIEDTLQTNQPGEEYGRLKDNEAVCLQRPGLEDTDMNRDYDVNPQWYSQDYVNGINATDESIPGVVSQEAEIQDVCRENDLYGRLAVRWMNESYIQDHPLAVTGGIDDSWNDRLGQMDHPYLISDPEGENWEPEDDMIEQGYSPVPTGTGALHVGYDSDYPDKSVVADPTAGDYGFCAGDDASEYVVTQEAETRHIDTDRSVMGVSRNPEACVLAQDRDSIEVTDNDIDYPEQRQLYEPGDTVEIETDEGASADIACFGGRWWGDRVISFFEDVETVELGDTGFSSFMVINTEDEARTFELGITYRNDDGDLEDMVAFEDTGTSEMEVTIPAEDALAYRLEITGNREIDTVEDDAEVEVWAESMDDDSEGQDQLDVRVVERETGVDPGDERLIPGLGLTQLLIIGLIASMIYYRKLRDL